eukprot:11777775-Ditylum_brightwellii.AAC.1
MKVQETQEKAKHGLQETPTNRMSLFNPQEFAMQMTNEIKKVIPDTIKEVTQEASKLKDVMRTILCKSSKSNIVPQKDLKIRVQKLDKDNPSQDSKED